MPQRRIPRALPFETLDEGELPYFSKAYVRGFLEYEKRRMQVISELGQSKLVQPIQAWVNHGDGFIVDAKRQLQAAIDRGIPGDISERMTIEAESFESVMSSKPTLWTRRKANNPEEEFLDQVDDYFEELCTRIGANLFGIYYVLKGEQHWPKNGT